MLSSFNPDACGKVGAPTKASEWIKFMKGFVYILKDEKDRFYIGSTNDIERRLKAHSAGNTQTTRRMIKPILVLSQEYENLEYARKIERRLKKLKRKDYIEEMIKVGYIRMKID